MAKTETGNYIKVTQLKSGIGHIEPQKRTIKALGLGKISSSSVLPDNPAVRGMVASVAHLVKVETAEKPLNMSISSARRHKIKKKTRVTVVAKAVAPVIGEIAASGEIPSSPKARAPRNEENVEAKATVSEVKTAIKRPVAKKIATATKKPAVAKKPAAKKATTPKKVSK
jgi:large subunit ribosomal protein L30